MVGVGVQLLLQATAAFASAAARLGLEWELTGKPLWDGSAVPRFVVKKGPLQYAMDLWCGVEEVLFVDREDKSLGLKVEILANPINVVALRDHVFDSRVVVLETFAQAENAQDFHDRMVAISDKFAAVRFGRVDGGKFVTEEVYGKDASPHVTAQAERAETAQDVGKNRDGSPTPRRGCGARFGHVKYGVFVPEEIHGQSAMRDRAD